MAQQETYGNWLGAPRGQRQPASLDSFEDDYDDVSLAGSERGPAPKAVYLLAGPPGSSAAPPDPDPKFGNSDPKFGNSDLKFGNFGNSDLKFGNSDLKFGNSDPKFGNFGNPDPKFGNFRNSDPKLGNFGNFDPKFGNFGNSDPKFGNSDLKFGNFDNPDPKFGSFGNSDPKFGNSEPAFGNFGNSESGNSGNSGCRKCGSAALAAALALLGLAWAATLALGLGKHQALRQELRSLQENISALQDSVQQEQTRLRFGIQQQQLEQRDLAEELCRALGSQRRCGAGWQPHGSSCFSFSREALSWGRARNACADLGARLAEVSDESAQVFLVSHSNRSSSYWLGLRAAEPRGKWRWLSGHEPGLSFWDVWSQEGRRQGGGCGALGPEGRWLSAPCSSALRWICQRSSAC